MGKVIPLPKGKYIKNLEINDDSLNISFEKRKKIALLFVSINDRYWPYLKQVIEDCQKHFLPHHKVDYFVWSDMPETDTPEYLRYLSTLLTDADLQKAVNDGLKPPNQWWGRETIQSTVNFLRNNSHIHISPTEGIDWPAPTLMRYHLFLQKEEELKDYDYVFYLDADMRVVDKVSDEILGEELTAAPHPGYVLNSRLLPPYEPNKDSAAYIHRLGQVRADEHGVNRFIPFYAAGGFQGGKTKYFLKSMKVMKEAIDKDFNNNYVAIWNDESHWNRYLWEFQKKGGKITFLDPSYVYPDSLIKEYYEPIWGRSYPPKIITITKPFSLTKQGGSEITKMIGGETAPRTICPQCKDAFETPGFIVKRIIECPGSGKPHKLDMLKTT